MTIKNLLIAFLFISLFFIFSSSAGAQGVKVSRADSTRMYRAQDVFIEVGGAGLFFSANYDTRFSQQRDGLGGRIGVGAWGAAGTKFISVPLQMNYLVGGRSNFFEVGAGATYMYLSDPYLGNPLIGHDPSSVKNSTVLPTTTIGYRYQPFNGGLSFRINFDPMLLQGSFIPYFGGSIGYSFR